MSLALCTIPVACGDDDEDEVIPNPTPGGSTVSPGIGDFGGDRLMAITDDYEERSSFVYNSDGTLYKVWDDGEQAVFNYQKGTLTITDDEEDESFTQVSSFKTNKQGYITELKVDDPCDDGHITGSFTFNYNTAGHLTSALYNSTYKDSSTSEVYNNSWQFTWDGDLLSKVDVQSTGTYTDEDGSWDEESSYTTYCTYTDAPNNAYMQYSVGLVNEIDFDSSLESLMLVGVFGKASSKLPTQIKSIFRGDDQEEEEISNFNYVLNSKGLIASETETYNEWGFFKYEYIYSSDATKSYSPSVKSKARSEHKKFNRKQHKCLFGKVK